MSVLFLAGGGAFIDGVTTNAAVRAAARIDLVPAAFAPLVAAAPFALDGIYIGATWTRAMRDLMLAAVLAFALALFAFEAAGLGNRGLWLAFLSFLAARGLGQIVAFRRPERRTFAREKAVASLVEAPAR